MLFRSDEEFLLQARQPSVQFGDKTPAGEQFQRAFAWLKQGDDRWLFAMERQAKDYSCIARDQITDMGVQNGDDWWLIPARAAIQCQGDPNAAPVFVAPTTLPDPDGDAPSL